MTLTKLEVVSEKYFLLTMIQPIVVEWRNMASWSMVPRNKINVCDMFSFCTTRHQAIFIYLAES